MTRFRIALNRGKSRRGPGLNFFFLLALLPFTVGREGNAKLAGLCLYPVRALL